MKKLLVVLVAGLMLFSCGEKKEAGKNYSVKEVDGIKVYSNTSKPAVDKVELNYKPLYEVLGDTDNEEQNFQMKNPAFDMDKDGNIYLPDFKSGSIKKYDTAGKLVQKYGQKGVGPGEFDMLMGTVVLNDTIYGIDAMMKINKFTRSGDYFAGFNFSQLEGFPSLIKKIDDKFVAMRTAPEQRDGKIYFNTSVVIMNSKFSNEKAIATTSTEFNPSKPMNPLSMVIFYAVNEVKKEIAVATKSTKKFEIKVYDYQGNQLYTIKKSYRAVAYSKQEVEKMNKKIKAATQNMQTPDFELEMDFQDAINSMWYDKYGRLWVNTAKEDDGKTDLDKTMNLDVFKDGVYQNSLTISKNSEDEMIYFTNDKLIFMDVMESKLKVCDY